MENYQVWPATQSVKHRLTSSWNKKYLCEFDFDSAYRLLLNQNFCCQLTGLPLYLAQTRKEMSDKLITASLDRIDSNQHYKLENVQWVHKDINWMKRSLSMSDFISICNKVSEHSCVTKKL